MQSRTRILRSSHCSTSRANGDRAMAMSPGLSQAASLSASPILFDQTSGQENVCICARSSRDATRTPPLNGAHPRQAGWDPTLLPSHGPGSCMRAAVRLGIAYSPVLVLVDSLAVPNFFELGFYVSPVLHARLKCPSGLTKKRKWVVGTWTNVRIV